MTKVEQLRPRKHKRWFIVTYKQGAYASSKTVRVYVNAYWQQQAVDHVAVLHRINPNRIQVHSMDADTKRKLLAGKLKAQTMDFDQAMMF